MLRARSLEHKKGRVHGNLEAKPRLGHVAWPVWVVEYLILWRFREIWNPAIGLKQGTRHDSCALVKENEIVGIESRIFPNLLSRILGIPPGVFVFSLKSLYWGQTHYVLTYKYLGRNGAHSQSQGLPLYYFSWSEGKSQTAVLRRSVSFRGGIPGGCCWLAVSSEAAMGSDGMDALWAPLFTLPSMHLFTHSGVSPNLPSYPYWSSGHLPLPLTVTMMVT